jgi:hypothetical protein
MPQIPRLNDHITAVMGDGAPLLLRHIARCFLDLVEFAQHQITIEFVRDLFETGLFEHFR